MSVIQRAIRWFRKRLFFVQMNAAFAALRKDPEAWAEEQKERDLWATADGDGLETQPRRKPSCTCKRCGKCRLDPRPANACYCEI